MKKAKFLLIIGTLFVSVFTFILFPWMNQSQASAATNKKDEATINHNKTSRNWVTSWNASPEPTWGSDFVLPTKIPDKMENQTIRQTARISIGGNQVRVVLSNEYSSKSLEIGEVHVALTDSGSDIISGSDKKLTFNGKTSAVVPAGATIMSDPVGLKVNSLEKVSVSLFLPKETELTTFHWDARQTNYIANGNVTSSTDFKADSTTDTNIFLSRILVNSPANKGTVVAIGDSTTDGNGATIDANARWTDYLAERLAQQNISVINAGISGNRLLSDGMGVSALGRFDRDVLSQPNVKSVIALIGINDISWPGTGFAPNETRPSFDELVSGYRQLIAHAHAHNIKIIGATLTPFEGALTGTELGDYYNVDKDTLRQKVNDWIRNSREFDAVIDLDALLKNPEHPTQLLPKYDSGDHLHPGDLGNKVIADSIDLNILK